MMEFEKDWIIIPTYPNYWGSHKSHVPNHQPDMYSQRKTKSSRSGSSNGNTRGALLGLSRCVAMLEALKMLGRFLGKSTVKSWKPWVFSGWFHGFTMGFNHGKLMEKPWVFGHGFWSRRKSHIKIPGIYMPLPIGKKRPGSDLGVVPGESSEDLGGFGPTGTGTGMIQLFLSSQSMVPASKNTRLYRIIREVWWKSWDNIRDNCTSH